MSGFAWPPKAGGTDEGRGLASSRASSAAPPLVVRARPRTIWGELEALLLGTGEVPFESLARANAWRPDPSDRYCPACVRDVGPGEVDGGRCVWCREESVPWERAVRLGLFEGVLREGLLAAKYRGSRVNAGQLGRRLGAALREALECEFGEGYRGQIAVTAIPTTFRRRMSRGIDHAGLIGRAAARELRCPFVAMLTRRHGPSQVSLPATKRSTNVRQTMRRVGPVPEAVRVLIVVDDVRTTGATMREAVRALLERGNARISGRGRGRAGSQVAGGTGIGSEVRVWAGFVSATGDERS